MYDRLLIPLDGSPASETAIVAALPLPSRSIRLVRVEPNLQRLAAGLLRDAGPDWRARHEAAVLADLDPAGAPLRAAGRSVELAVRFGDPAEEIIAASADADLVVMATQGRGAAGRALFGSVADRVARHGSKPTLFVRHDQPKHVPDRIVVTLDGSPLAETALPVATALATALRKPIHLVRIVDTGEIVRALRLEGNFGEVTETASKAYHDEVADYLAARAGELRAHGVRVEQEVRGGNPASELLGLIRPDDLIVLTSRGQAGVRRWLLGSVAEKLVRHAPAPVLLVRAGDDAGAAD